MPPKIFQNDFFFGDDGCVDGCGDDGFGDGCCGGDGCFDVCGDDGFGDDDGGDGCSGGGDDCGDDDGGGRGFSSDAAYLKSSSFRLRPKSNLYSS
jgi:hypothetical protein